MLSTNNFVDEIKRSADICAEKNKFAECIAYSADAASSSDDFRAHSFDALQHSAYVCAVHGLYSERADYSVDVVPSSAEQKPHFDEIASIPTDAVKFLTVTRVTASQKAGVRERDLSCIVSEEISTADSVDLYAF